MYRGGGRRVLPLGDDEEGLLEQVELDQGLGGALGALAQVDVRQLRERGGGEGRGSEAGERGEGARERGGGER